MFENFSGRNEKEHGEAENHFSDSKKEENSEVSSIQQKEEPKKEASFEESLNKIILEVFKMMDGKKEEIANEIFEDNREKIKDLAASKIFSESEAE